MVRKVKKIIMVLSLMSILIATLCGSVSAATYDVYEGNISSTQLTYFRDILGNTSIIDNYVVFRDGQNSYSMVVGNLEYNNGTFSLAETGMIYNIDSTSTSGYNSYYSYTYNEITDFTLNTNNRIVYSDLGQYPQLEERGQKYEILQTILLCTACVCFIIRNIFYNRKR